VAGSLAPERTIWDNRQPPRRPSNKRGVTVSTPGMTERGEPDIVGACLFGRNAKRDNGRIYHVNKTMGQAPPHLLYIFPFSRGGVNLLKGPFPQVFSVRVKILPGMSRCKWRPLGFDHGNLLGERGKTHMRNSNPGTVSRATYRTVRTASSSASGDLHSDTLNGSSGPVSPIPLLFLQKESSSSQ